MPTVASEPGRACDRVGKVVEALGRSIVSGTPPPGAKLPVEQEICATFGVSRVVVREAVKTLASKHMLRSARRAGTIVEPFESWNLLDPQVIDWMLTGRQTRETLINALSELRLIIEPEATALAAARASTEKVLHLFELYEAMERNAKEPNKAVASDVAFHLAILDATGNALLRTFSKAFGMLLEANFKLSVQVDNAFIRNLEDHRRIAEAVRDRNVESARKYSRALLEKNEADMSQIRKQLSERQ